MSEFDSLSVSRTANGTSRARRRRERRRMMKREERKSMRLV